MDNDREFVNGYLDGLRDGRGGLTFSTQNRNDMNEIGYFEGFKDGKKDSASDEWTPYLVTVSPRTIATHDWEPCEPKELGDGLEELVESCPCGAKKHSLIMRRNDGVEIRNYIFRLEPYPLTYCKHTGRLA